MQKKNRSIFIEGLEPYIDNNYTKKPTYLGEIEDFAKKSNFPILAPNSATILLFLTKFLKPSSILELGTGLGYSTSWFLESKIENLKIITVDREEKNQIYAKKQIESFYKEFQIEFIQSDCVKFLEDTKNYYDLVFIDCDKVSYPKCCKLLLQKKGIKYAIFDNMLWGGRILNEHKESSDLAIHETWELIRNSRLPYTLFPSGDGLLLVELNHE